MKRLFLLGSIITLLISCNSAPQTSEPPKVIQEEYVIGFDKIKEMFDEMKSSGVNTDTEMLYGYFFNDKKREKLEKVGKELSKKGFQFVEIYSDTTELFWLHLERIEIHNAESLYNLDKELYAIADKYEIESYDGFDVGNADKTKPIETK
ncbi:MAG: ribonuclease E inhibitor RraB [Bacteroidia bacterium]